MNSNASATALIIAVMLFGALVAWIVWSWRASGHTFWQFFWYTVNDFFTRVLWRTEVSGPLPVPDGQGAVIVCNHSSGIDPLLIQLCTNRVVHWMVAREFFEMAGIKYTFRALRSISVSRAGVDTAATKTAIRLAREGGLVGLFPEGRINQTSELLLPGRNGAALIALKARVPVIPCYVSGAPYDGTALGSFFMPARARVIVGQPIDLSPYFEREGDKTVLQELTKRFLVEIAKLAGVPDFEPKLAGRDWKIDTDNGNGNGDGTNSKPNAGVSAAHS